MSNTLPHSPLDLAYAAGIFDGEGCVSVHVIRPNRGLGNYTVRAYVSMACPYAVERLFKMFGGTFRVRHMELRNPNHRKQFIWIKQSYGASLFLKAIQPYVVVKRDEVELALELQDNITLWKGRLSLSRGRYGGRQRLHPEALAIMAWRKSIAARISQLKRQHYDTPPSCTDTINSTLV